MRVHFVLARVASMSSLGLALIALPSHLRGMTGQGRH